MNLIHLFAAAHLLRRQGRLATAVLLWTGCLTACVDRHRGPGNDAVAREQQGVQGAYSADHGPSAPISGEVFFLQRVAGVPVVLWSVDQAGQRGTPLATTTTDDVGRFGLDAGTYEGPALLEAQLASPEQPLTVAIEEVTLGTVLPPLAVTPVTSLIASYAAYLTRDGRPWRQAVAASAQALDAHFFALDHVHTVPEAWPIEAGHAGTSCELARAELQASLLCRGLSEVGARRLTHGGRALTPEEGLQRLLAGLQEDVRDDGKWDGVTTDGALSPAYVQLGTEAARDALVEGMRAFLDGPSNHSGCSAADAEVLMAHLRASAQAPLVYREPKELEPFPVAAPTVKCRLYDAEGEERNLDEVVRGTVQLACAWQSGVELREVGLDGHDGLPWVRLLPSSEAGGAHAVQVELDTAAVEAKHGVHELSVGVQATDAVGQTSRHRALIRFRNAAPQLKVGAMVGTVGQLTDAGRFYYEAGREIAFPLQVHPATQTVRLCAEGRILDEQRLAVSDAVDGPLVPVTLRTRLTNCNRTTSISVRVEDLAGNVFARVLEAACLSDGPHIVPLPSDNVPDYPMTTAPLEQGWDGRAVVTLYKFVSRLDYDPVNGKTELFNNLPVLRFRIDDATAGYLAPPYRVSYAYRYIGTERPNAFPVAMAERPFEPLMPQAPGTYALPLSYQTLLPRSLWEGDAERGRRNNYIAASLPGDIHEVVVRVENEAGAVDEKIFRFHFHLTAPGIEVRNVAIAPQVRALRYENALQALRWGEEDVLTADVVWPLNWSIHSLMPRLELDFVATTDMTVDAVVEDIEQYDRRDCWRDEPCYRGPWPPRDKCDGQQHKYPHGRGRNTAWSQSRGCHPPVRDKYGKRAWGFMKNSTKGEDECDKNFIAPRNWVKCTSHAARVAVVPDTPAVIGFRFPINAHLQRNWVMSRGRDDSLRLYHVLSEDDFHFLGNSLHVLTTDYYVAQFALKVDTPTGERLQTTLKDPRFPGPIEVRVVHPAPTVQHDWGLERFPERHLEGAWDRSRLPDYSTRAEVNPLNQE